MTPEEIDMERLKTTVENLAEHFDTVHIFVTRVSDEEVDEGGTVNACFGTGNWFARSGQIKEWVLKQDERARKEVREE